MKKIWRIFEHPYFPLFAAPVLLFSPVLFTGKALFWGTPATQFVPWWKWAFDTVLSGHLPLWNPLLGMGAPLIANYQSALFYPPNWIYFIFYLVGGVAALAWSQALVVVLHLIWAGLGMAVLGRRLGLGKLAQTVAGLAFSLSGYLVARAWFASVNTTVSWLPWIMVFSYDISVEHKKILSTLKLGVVVGLQLLAGHAQTSWYTLLLAVLWMSLWAWQDSRHTRISSREGFKVVFKGWVYLGAAILLGAAIGAVQLTPTAAYLLQSQRATATGYEAAVTYSLWPWRLLGLAVPDLFGTPVKGDYWGYGNYWEDALYVGMAPLLLAVGVIFRALLPGKQLEKWHHSRRAGSLKGGPGKEDVPQGINGFGIPRFLLVIMALSILLALGDHTPIFPWLYRHVPTFDMFQSPTRYSIWMIFSLALFAGIGIERWRRPQQRGLYWTRLGTAAAFAVTAGATVGGYLLKGTTTDLKPTFVPAIALAGFWGLGTGLLSLAAPKEETTREKSAVLWKWGVILWVSADLLVAGLGLNPGIDLEFYRSQPPKVVEIRDMVGEGRLFLIPEDEHELKYKRYFRFDSFNAGVDWQQLRQILLPNLNLLEEIPSVNNYDPLVPGRYASWMERLVEVNFLARPDLLNRMAVSVLEWEAPGSQNGVRFFSREGASRSRWVPCARKVADEMAALELIFSGRIDSWEEVVIEEGESTGDLPCTDAKGTTTMLSENPNEVLLGVQADSAGWVVLSDTWYWGWQATLDGKRVPIFHADYLYRAVNVPAGSHQVRFVYRPPWFYTGMVISGLAWVVILITFKKKAWQPG